MEKQGTRAHLGHELALLRRLKAQRYDLVVNPADQWRSAIITRLTGARIRLGFDFPKRRGFLWRHCHAAGAGRQSRPPAYRRTKPLAAGAAEPARAQ